MPNWMTSETEPPLTRLYEVLSVAKKNDVGEPTGRAADKYFRKKTSLNVRSIPALMDLLGTAVLRVQRHTDLKFPDQNQLTQEVMLGLMCVWIEDLTSKGTKEFERVMRPHFAKLVELVAEDIKTRPKEVPPKGTVSHPKREAERKRRPSNSGPHTE